MGTRVRCLAVAAILAGIGLSGPAHATLFTIDSSPGGDLDPFTFANANWSITFHPAQYNGEAFTVPANGGSVTNHADQDWLIFTVTVDSLTAPTSAIEEIGVGSFPDFAEGVAHIAGDLGVDASDAEHGPSGGPHSGTAIFFYAGLTAGQSTDRLIVAYAPGTFTLPSDSVNFMIKDEDSFLDDEPTTIVPEPTTGLLLGMGLVGLAVAGRRRRA